MTPRELDNAKHLLAGSQVFATNCRDGFAAQYPTLAKIADDEWRSLLAVAAIGTALLMIPSRFSLEDQRELTGHVVAALKDWNESVVQHLSDFISAVSSQSKSSEHVPDTIGSWVLRNINLTETEHSAPHVMGMILLNTFGPWWDQ